MKTAIRTDSRTVSAKITQRLGRLNLPARASLFYTVSGVLSRASAFLFTPIFTRIMSRETLGQYSLFTTYLGILSTIGSLELCTGVLYTLLSKNEGDTKRLMRYAQITVYITTCISYLVLYLFHYIRGQSESFRFFYPALLICALSRTTLMLFNGKSRYRYKYKCATLLTLLEAIAPSLITLALSGFVGSGYLGALRAFSLAFILFISALPIAIKTLCVRKSTTVKSEALKDLPTQEESYAQPETIGRKGIDYIKEILRAALPTLPYFIFVTLISSADRVIIANTLTQASLAEYGVAYSLGSAVTMLCAGVGGIMTPWIMRKYKSNSYNDATRCCATARNLIAIMTLIFLCFAPELFSILAPREYMEALPLVYPIALCSLPLFLSGLTASCLMGYECRRPLIVCALIPAALSIGANLILLRPLGIFPASVISLTSNLLLFTLLSLSLKRISGKCLINANSYLQITLFSLVIARVIYIARGSILIRIIFAAALLLALVPELLQAKKFVKEK